MAETLEQKIERVLKDKIDLVPYDPNWPNLFNKEKAHLLTCLPSGLISRIEHYGSTSMPGMTAKPVVDILVEVQDLNVVRREVPPILEAQGYDYFWRPIGSVDEPPYYAWFIKRNADGSRSHHIHMVEQDSRLWEGIVFRDYIRSHPEQAEAYERLKLSLANKFPNDRISYTNGKTDFILETLVSF